MAELIISVRAWFVRYIMFYLTAVANEDNISLIYYIAQRAKQYRDRLSPTNPDVCSPV
jgi:sister-chromatid-cohesion protein PDS5